MKKRNLITARLSLPLASAIAALIAAPTGSAATYYWDNNGTTAGFGTAAGTWAAPTVGSATLGWSTSSAGTLLPGTVTTATADALNFGNGATGLAAGTVTVSGAVDAGNITFASGSGAIALSGGSINLANTAVITNNNTGTTAHTISAAITVGDTITKAGTGAVTVSGALTIPGTSYKFANTATGNFTNGLVFTVSSILSGVGNSVAISGTAPVYLTGATPSYGGGTTVNAGSALGLATTALTSLGAGSISMEPGATIMRSGGSLDNTFLGKLAPTSNSFTIIANNANSSAALDLTNFPNASLATWDNVGTTTFAFTGAITPGSNGYRFGSTRVGNLINITTAGTLTGANSLNLLTGSLGQLKISAAQTFSGTTLLSASTLQVATNLAIQNSVIDTSGAGVINVTSATAPTFGGLNGSKNITSLITTAYTAVTSLTLNPGSGQTPSFSGILSNGAAGMTLTKSGLGTQLLSGLNSFTGNVTVSGGTLAGAVAGSGGNSAFGSVVSTRTLNVNTGGTLRADVGNIFNNNFASAATSVPALNIAGGTVTNGGTATNSALGNVTLAGGTLTATVGSATGYGSWNLNGTVTSTGASTLSSTAGIPITLSAAAGTTTTFDVLSGTLTASAALGEVTASGDARISSLTKIGAGTLALSGVNTYTGNTAINAGALSIASKDALPGSSTTGRFTVASGAALAVQNGVSYSDITTLLATGNFLSGANLGFDTTAGHRDVSLNLADAANGPLGIVKLGANTLTLSGTNTYTGTTTILAGALYLGSTSSLPNWNVNGGFSVASGASLVIPNTVSESEVTTLLGTTNVAAGASLLFDTSAGDRTYSSAVTNSTQGLLHIGKIGANSLTLAGANTYTGNTTVTNGTLNITGSIAGNFTASTLAYGETAGNTVVNLSGTLTAFKMTGANVVGAVSVFNQTAGSLTMVPTNGQDVQWVAKTGYGALNITGGTFNTGRFDLDAQAGTNAVGTVYVGGTGVFNNNVGDWLILARGGNNLAQLTVGPGGSLVRGQAVLANLGITMDGTNSQGVLNIAGGVVDSGLRAIQFGFGTVGAGNQGFVNLAGGTLSIGLAVNETGTAGSTAAFFNFAGGTLKSNASLTAWIPATSIAGHASTSTIFGPITNNNNANAAFNTAIGTTSNFTGGLTVDTNNFPTTFTNSFLAASGFGVTQADIGNVSLLPGNSGYIGAPAVTFSNPAAAGADPASGYAVISGGMVTGIVITNPGVYASNETLLITLSGGGGSIAPFSTSALATTNTSGGLTKTGAGVLTLSGTNTYTGATTVNAGSLTVAGAGTLSATSGLTVGSGASFNFLPTTVGTNLALPTLVLQDGSSIGLAWDAVTSNRITASGAASVGTGAGVAINLTGIPTLDTPYTILAAASGLNAGSYVLLNPTDYYGTINKSATAVSVTATTATPLTVAYWKGGFTGYSGVWAVSNGLSGATGLSNWTSDAAGAVNTAVVPGSGTDVFLSSWSAGAGDQNAMSLGANMVINSLTVNDAGSPNANPVTLLGTDSATLTLAAASGTGITVNAGSGAVTLASNVALGSSQTWSNHSTNTLTLSGAISGAFGLTKAGAGLLNITGVAAVPSTTVDDGSLYMGAQTGTSTTTTLGAASTVTLNGTSNLTIRRTNTGAVDLTGPIGGNGSLTLLGDNATTSLSGDFTLNNASTFSGGTSIIGARAATTLGTALGSGSVTIGTNGGIFVNAASQTFTNDFTIGGLGWNEPSGYLGALRLSATTISGTITLTANTRITGTGTSTLSGIISGNFGLDFFEDTVIGTVSLLGDNTYTGTTTVNSMGSGTSFPNLIVSHNNALGTTAGGTIVVGTGTTGNGSQLTLANGITVTNETLTLDSTSNAYRATLQTSGTATWDGNVMTAGTGGFIGFNTAGTTSVLTIGSSDADTITGTNALMIRGTGAGTVNSSLSMGSGGIFKTDTGIWTITSNNNDFTGTPSIAAGILSVGSIADSGINSALGAGTAIALGQNSTTVGTLQFTGSFGGSSNRSLSIANGTSGGSGVIENAISGQTLALSGALTAATPASASALTLTGAGDGALSGGIVGAPLMALSKTGAGTWTLSGATTYTGATSVTAGTLTLSAASVFNSATAVGTFTINGATAVANIAGTYHIPVGNANAFFEIKGGGTLNFNGTSTLTSTGGGGFRVGEASAGTFNVTGGSLTYSAVSGSNFVVGRTTGGNGNVNVSNGTLTVTGAGGFVIANDPTTTGTVTVGGTGTLVVNTTTFRIGGSASATAATVNLNTGGTFALGTTPTNTGGTRTFNFDGGTLKASANIAISGLTTANVKNGGAIFDTDGNSITINQALLNFAGATTDSLTKSGAGSLTLSGVNTYTGVTTVNAGTLLVNSPGSLAASSAVAVNGTSTLGGSGTIGGSVTVATAGNLAPGASAGTLTVTGLLDISAQAAGTGKLVFELATLAASDKIVAGTVNIGSGVLGFNDFAFTNLGGLQVGTYKLITSSGLTGTLDSANLTGTIGAFKAALQLTGNDVELVVSSAYASWAALKGLDDSDAAHSSARNADPDGDGRNNLYEFAFDGNPLAGATDGKIVGKIAPVGINRVMTLTLPVRTGATFSDASGDQISALIDDIYYRIEGDVTLSPFADTITEVPAGADLTAIQAGLPALSSGWSYRTFRAPGTVPAVPKAFLRAKISETP